jgi:hypothetical protein
MIGEKVFLIVEVGLSISLPRQNKITSSSFSSPVWIPLVNACGVLQLFPDVTLSRLHDLCGCISYSMYKELGLVQSGSFTGLRHASVKMIVDAAYTHCIYVSHRILNY